MINDENKQIENIEEEAETSLDNSNDIENKTNSSVEDSNSIEDINDNKEEVNDILSDSNYLEKNILDIKTYSYEDITKIDININEENTFEVNDSFDSQLPELHEKQLVKGTVVSINDKEVLIDIGFKSEGTISLSEFDVVPAIGEEIDIFLVVFEDRHGRLILSKERADFEKKWMNLRNAFADETVIRGTIIKRIKGGLVVDLNGVNAFLPGSQVDVKPTTDFDQYLSNEYEFKIVKFNEMRQNIVVSRKALMSQSFDKNSKEILEKITVGMELDGIVKNITDFGAFIDLGNSIDGLLHITDITWGRINNPSDKLSLGENIKVKVIDIDEVKNRISLGTKQLTQDPWLNLEDKYTEGLQVNGKVVNIMNYGIFIEIEEGIEGLVHISEFSWTKHIKHPSDLYKTGDKIDVIILSVDNENKKISLGIKQLNENPWDNINDKYSIGQSFNSMISTVLNNGFYVNLDSNMEGFVGNEDISWTRKIKNPSLVYSKNDKVDVQILEINEDDKKIKLGIKQLIDDPWVNISDFLKIDDKVTGKILFKMDRGIVVLLDNDFEGIIPASKISGSIDQYKVDEQISLLINEIDEDNRKIVLSIEDEKNIENSSNDDDKSEESTKKEESSKSDLSTKDSLEESSIESADVESN